MSFGTGTADAAGSTASSAAAPRAIHEREERVKDGWFSSVDRQIFTLDPFAGRGAETGTTRMERMIILPERPFQALVEKKPAGFADVRKFVVGSGGRVIAQR